MHIPVFAATYGYLSWISRVRDGSVKQSRGVLAFFFVITLLLAPGEAWSQTLGADEIRLVSRLVVLPDPSVRFSYNFDVEAFRSAPTKEPSNAKLKAALVEGKLALKARKYDEAVQIYLQIATSFPENPLPASRLCQVLMALGKIQDANGIAALLMENHPQQIDGYVCYGALGIMTAFNRGEPQYSAQRLNLDPLRIAREEYTALTAPLTVLEDYLISALMVMDALTLYDRTEGPWVGLPDDHPTAEIRSRIADRMKTIADEPGAPAAVWSVLASLAILSGDMEGLGAATAALAKHGGSEAGLERSLFVLSLMDRPGPAIDILNRLSDRLSEPKYQHLRIWFLDKAGDLQKAQEVAEGLPSQDPYRSYSDAVLMLRSGDTVAAAGAFGSVETTLPETSRSYYKGIAALLSGDRPAAHTWLKQARQDAYYRASADGLRHHFLMPER
ncbi:MAG: tetratricopeptide repeat protein [Magnetospiraceae bacterium]